MLRDSVQKLMKLWRIFGENSERIFKQNLSIALSHFTFKVKQKKISIKRTQMRARLLS